MSEYKNVPFVPCNDCANYESCTNDFVADLLEPYDAESIEDLITNVRNKTIDEVIKTLAKSEDTILTDKQYYEVLKLKGGANNGEE